MAQDNALNRFDHLAERYDALHRPGAWLDVKNELGLGSGPFNDQLSTAELQELNEELEHRLKRSHQRISCC